MPRCKRLRKWVSATRDSSLSASTGNSLDAAWHADTAGRSSGSATKCTSGISWCCWQRSSAAEREAQGERVGETKNVLKPPNPQRRRALPSNSVMRALAAGIPTPPPLSSSSRDDDAPAVASAAPPSSADLLVWRSPYDASSGLNAKCKYVCMTSNTELPDAEVESPPSAPSPSASGSAAAPAPAPAPAASAEPSPPSPPSSASAPKEPSSAPDPSVTICTCLRTERVGTNGPGWRFTTATPAATPSLCVTSAATNTRGGGGEDASSVCVCVCVCVERERGGPVSCCTDKRHAAVADRTNLTQLQTPRRRT